MGASDVSVARHVVNTISDVPVLRIHPAIGIARVGDAAADEFFIGPEISGEGPTGQHAGVGTVTPPYKTAGLIKRQAARFRIFEYVFDKAKNKFIAEEVTLSAKNITEIEWTVHLANRKASFFRFNGTAGESGTPYRCPSGTKHPDQEPRRNPTISDPADRVAKLEIDPGPKTVKGALDKKPITNPNAAIPIPTLGELRTDSDGRLLVLGGTGKSDSSASAKPRLRTYANNDTWFDDVSDGPVTVKVTFKNAKGELKTVEAKGVSWVLVGPPDFAPRIGNVISLYEAIYDVAARSIPLPADNPIYDDRWEGDGLKSLKELKAKGTSGAGGYLPSYKDEIRPVLKNAFDSKWVYGPSRSAHSTIDLNALADPSAANAANREFIFDFLRDRAGGGGTMPKLLGDEPYGDAPRGILVPGPKARLSLTQTQMDLFKQWKEGHFRKDFSGGAPAPSAVSKPYTIVKGDTLSGISKRFGMTWQQLYHFKGDTDKENAKRLRSGDPNLIFPGEVILVPGTGGGGGGSPPATAGKVTPEGLDKAALENCVGGAFFPGIEVGWEIRNSLVYEEPFRIKLGAKFPITFMTAGGSIQADTLEVRAGFFSQQMALPWQADFHDCKMEGLPTHKDGNFGWWPAQRPDVVEVKKSDGTTENKPWARATAPNTWPSGSADLPTRDEMVDRFSKLGFVLEDPAKPGTFVEAERTEPVP